MMWSLGDGTHLVKVADHALTKSSTGKQRVSVQFEAETDAGVDRITWDGYLTDAAYGYTVDSLRILGWKPEEHDGMVTSLNGTRILVGNEVEIVVETEEYEGKYTPKVKWINNPGGGMGAAMEEDEADAFAKQLRQKILSATKPTPSAKAGAAKPVRNSGRQPATAHAGKPGFDDDLPF